MTGVKHVGNEAILHLISANGQFWLGVLLGRWLDQHVMPPPPPSRTCPVDARLILDIALHIWFSTLLFVLIRVPTLALHCGAANDGGLPLSIGIAWMQKGLVAKLQHLQRVQPDSKA